MWSPIDSHLYQDVFFVKRIILMYIIKTILLIFFNQICSLKKALEAGCQFVSVERLCLSCNQGQRLNRDKHIVRHLHLDDNREPEREWEEIP